MADLAALKTRIASEINRSDLTTSIADAITTAITYCRSLRLEFNEVAATFATVDGEQAYTTSIIPTDIAQIDMMQITSNGRITPMDPMGYADLKALTTATDINGEPSLYAWYAQKIHLYPIPDGIYTITISYLQREAAPANDADGTTVWTNAAEPLVRALAKKFLCRDVMRDPEGMALAQSAENEALAMLRAESLQLQDDGSPLSGVW